MKNRIINSIKLLMVFLGFTVLVSSCEYQDIADADYPAPTLYMPAAVNGIFTIDDVPQRMEFIPTPGEAYRFTVDMTNNKFTVPLGVYRSGIDRKGLVTADIAVNTDTINELLNQSVIPGITGILPAANFSLPSSVDVPSGQEVADFSLDIDLNYLHGFADTVFAIGVGISSSDIEVNPKYKTTIVLIYTKILNPVADFSPNNDATDSLKINFANNSSYGVKYLWDFGDGATDTLKSPVHAYTSAGTYTAKLTTIGVLGTVNQSEISKDVEVGN